MNNDPISKGKRRAGELLHAGLTAIKEAGGSLAGSDVLKEISKRVELTDHEKQRYEKTGYVRWESVVHFYSIDCAKAGYIRKNKGMWYLTPEGEHALRLHPHEFMNNAVQKYREWKRSQPEKTSSDDDEAPEAAVSRETALSQAEERAHDEIVAYINSLNEWEFQDLVAALLRGMGYYTPFIAPKGADGGIDILAYTDPLGGKPPRFKVQVKHHERPIGERDVRDLTSVLNTDGDIGLLVSSGGFSKPAEKFAQNAGKHIELIDLQRLVDLWIQFFGNMVEEDKSLMPLRNVAFLAPTRD